MEADQHLIDHLLVAEGLHQARAVAGQVDQHIGAALDVRLHPQHAQPLVAVDLAAHARLAVPHRGLELEQDLVAPAVGGALDGGLLGGVQRRGHLHLTKGAQRHRHHHVVGLVAIGAGLDRHAARILDDARHLAVGLDRLDLLDEGLGQDVAAAGQARGAQVLVLDAAIDAGLLGQIEQRQPRGLVIAHADALVDQLAGHRRQILLVQPGGGVDLVEGVQGRGGGRLQRIADGGGQVVQGLVDALQGIGHGRHLLHQVVLGIVLAVDQIARGAHEGRRVHGLELEGVQVVVEHRLGLGVADPFAGGETGATADARAGFQQGHVPAGLLQFIGRGQTGHAGTDHDHRGTTGRDGRRGSLFRRLVRLFMGLLGSACAQAGSEYAGCQADGKTCPTRRHLF